MARALWPARMAVWVSADPGIQHAPLAAMARARRAPSGDCRGVWLGHAPP